MKKNKFIATSIASMMLVAGMAMPKALAATTTESRYAKNYIDSDTYAIAVGLANGNTVLTRSELSDLVKKYDVTLTSVTDPSNKEITSNTAKVPNGSKVTLSTGNKATVVLYGDIEVDGNIDLNDAQAALDAYTGAKAVSGAAFKAADVEVETSGSARVDLNDAQRLFDYLYNTSAMENGLAVANQKLPENNTNYDSNISIVLTDEYVNNVNESSFPVKVSLNKALDSTKTYTLSVVNSKGVEVISGTDVKFNENAGETVISIDKPLSFASVADDGTYTIVLKDENGNVVASKTVQKISDNGPFPTATKIETHRFDSVTGQLGFSALGESDIVKVYYQVDGDEPDDASTLVTTETTKSLPVSGNKLNLTNLDATLTHESHHTVYFVVENSKGNISDVYTAIIAKDTTDVHQEKIAKSITPTAKGFGTKTTITAGADFEAGANTVKAYYLYKDGTLVAENQNGIFDVTEPGNYTVGVVVKGTSTGTTTDSEELKSEQPIKVEKLDKVSAIKFTAFDQEAEDDTDGKLTWNGTDSDAVFKYVVSLSKFDGEDFETPTDHDVSRAADGKLVKELAVDLTPNTLYKASIKAISQGANGSSGSATYLELNSDAEEMETYFFILSENVFTSASAISSKEIVLDVNKSNFKLGDETISYDVEIWATVGGDGVDSHLERIDTRRNVIPTDESTDTTDKLLINNLTPGTAYEFVLVVKVGNATAKSPNHTQSTTTMSTLPSLQNLTVAEKEEDVDLPSGSVALSGGKLYIGNVEVDESLTYEEDAAIDLLKQALTGLVTGDKISVTNDLVSVTITSQGTETGSHTALTTRNFGTLTDVTLEVTGNGFEQKIEAASAKKVVLKGSGSRFDISGVTAADIVVENGVIITKAPAATQEFQVENGAQVGNVAVKAEGGNVALKVSSSTISVTTNNEASKLTLTNENEEDVTVEILADDAGSESNLSVTISAHGDITITPNSKLNGAINVTLTDGSIDLTNPKLAGNFVVTMNVTTHSSSSDDRTIVVPVSRLAVPEGVTLSGNYTLKAEYESSDYSSVPNRDKLIEFLTGFGYKADQGVSLNVSGTTATFKFTAEINTTLNF